MRGLSVTPPWPWAITVCGKRIENREKWKGCSYRGPIAVHASSPPALVATWHRRASLDSTYQPTERQEDELGEFLDRVRFCSDNAKAAGIETGPVTMNYLCGMAGRIVGTSSIVGVVLRDGTVHDDSSGSRVVRALTEDERRWWAGGFALLLGETRRVEPHVPCRGALGLWTVPAAIEAQVRVRVAA